VLDRNGKLVTVTMGSYGIGVTRAVAALAEAYHDDKGLLWPRQVAPAAAVTSPAGAPAPEPESCSNSNRSKQLQCPTARDRRWPR
ncbi:MAG TPA: hypothetical protein VHG93_08290, partial [Longimicrobium sp.]|nr:hypothetical protein [Longimicrobium sp.]